MLAHHRAGGAEDPRPDPRCRSASGARCAAAALPGRSLGCRGPRKKPMSGDSAPKQTQAMLMTKSTEHHLLDAGQLADREHQPHLVREHDRQQQRATRRGRAAPAAPRVSPWSRARARSIARAAAARGIASGASGGSGAAARRRRRASVSCSIGRPRSRRSGGRRSEAPCASQPRPRPRGRDRT